MDVYDKIIKSNHEIVPYSTKNFKLKQVLGDGDCAYHSFIESMNALYSDVEVPLNTTDLRKQLIDFIEMNDLFDLKKDNIVDRIRSGIKNKGTGWAENEEFEALARMFDVCIAIWSELEKLWQYFYHKDIDAKLIATDGCKRIIFLFNSSQKQKSDFLNSTLTNVYSSSNQAHGLHYDFLLPKETEMLNDDDTDSEDDIISETNTDSDEDDLDNDEDEDEDNEEDDDEDDLVNDEDEDEDNEEDDDDLDNDEDDDKDEEDAKKEISKIKKLSLKKRFEYFKRKIEEMENTEYSNIQKIKHVSDLIKPVKKTHRLLEHAEYFVDTKNETPIDGFSFTKNQKFLKKFMSMDTLNVGLLLFHGVGVGKTCSSILIAENFVNMFDKKILVLLPSSLENNYRKELFDVTKLDYVNGTYDSCNGKRYLDTIPNWSKMSKMEVDKKIQKMVNEEYSFYGYLKLVNFVELIKKKSKKIFGKHQEEKRNLFVYTKLKEHFSNRMIIIDEVHNVRLSNEKSMKKFPKVLKLILRCADNVRLLLLSATPMFDSADEVSWIMDFMYMVDSQYMSYDTNIEFNEAGKLTKSSEKKIKHFSKNYVSYMRGYDPNTFPIKYFEAEKDINHPKQDMLKSKNKIEKLESEEYKFQYSIMKGKQLEMYTANKNNLANSDRDIQNRIQLSNIVYPNDDNDPKMSKGKRGFLNNFQKQDGKLLKVKYSGKNQFLKNTMLDNYSSKLFNILTNVSSADGLVLVYSKYLYSGIIPCAIALEHIGFNKYNRNNILIDKDKIVSKGSSYIILTADESISPNNAEELTKFNDETNNKGQHIKVALINEIAAEGVSFKNVREVHILEPWYNMNKIEQIIGRGVRFYSHHTLPEEERNVSVFLHTNIDNSDQETVDYRRYRMSLNKQEKINAIEKLMKENAIDCRINNISKLNIDTTILDSKGLKKKIKYQYDNIKCTQSKIKVGPMKASEMNLRMLLFDIIETSKKIKWIIESKSMYIFGLKDMEEEYENQLVKPTLEYMCKNRTIVNINSVKGHLIKSKREYVFQQYDVDDIKINIADRKRKARDHVGNYIVALDDMITKTKIDEQLLKQVKQYSTLMERVFKDVNDLYIYDMVADRIEYEYIQDVPNIQNMKMLDSLKEGGYILVRDKELYAFYNMYEMNYLCKRKAGYVACNVKENDMLINEQKKRHLEKNDDVEMLGFIDVIEKVKRKKYEVKSKILYMDKNYNKSFGSACISTSTITINILKQKILEFEKDVNLKSVNKRELCLIYEYLLRQKNKFLRSIVYQLNKN